MKSRFKVLITTHPFAEKDKKPIRMLEQNGIEYCINPFAKKMTEEELISVVTDYDALIAGTELISKKVLDAALNLKLISRVGIGLDSVDLNEARNRNIKVSYTPDAPSPAAAELTVGHFLNLLRSIHISNNFMHKGQWHRFFGKRIQNASIGIIGFGRIGKRVVNILQGFGCEEIFVNDLDHKKDEILKLGLNFSTKEKIFKNSDIVSIHVPLTKATNNLITIEQLNSMKDSSFIVNTSRGGIINEKDLYYCLKNQFIAGAGIDTFDKEPYNGPLCSLDNCLLTSHMGSMSLDCRAAMEIQATEEIISFVNLGKTYRDVPEEEYEIQNEMF